MDLQLKDKICLVTGASTGIGSATALALAAEGAQVVVAARSLDALSDVSARIEAAGGIAAVLLAANFGEDTGAERLAAAALAAMGQVDVLVNNAGGSRPMSAIDDQAVWAESFQLNFVAARRLGEALLPAMAARGWGRVINVTGAIIGKAVNAASPAKAALESWSKATAATYAARGVTVNCVAPGRLNSRQILERLHPTEESRRDFIERNIPAGHFGEPEEAASLIAFLASAQASYVNGTTIPVDGGALRYAF